MDSKNSKDSKNSRNILERFLGLFADVRGGEGVTVLLLGLNVFLLLLLYYIIKTVREPLIRASGGAEAASYSSAGQAILLLVAVPLYAVLASRFPRRRLINIVTLFFVACLAGFYILAQFNVPYLGVAFFLWVGIFNLMIIAQFWSFANDLYTPEAGKRLFAIVAFGASLGAVLGGLIARRLIDPFGVYQLLLVAGGLLALSLLVTNTIDSRERHKAEEVATVRAREAEKPIGKGGAYRLVFGNKYLLMIALLMLFLNWVNTTGEFILRRTVYGAADKQLAAPAAQELFHKEYEKALEDGTVNERFDENYKQELDAGTVGNFSEEEFKENKFKESWEEDYKDRYVGKFYGGFFSVVNLLSLGIQLFLVSRILKYLGVRVALLVLPVIALGGYAFLIFYPVLGIVRWVKTAENSTDYSLQNTVRQVLFLPLTREQKYKAKQATDTFFVRAGDVLQAVLVFVGVRLAFETKHFAMVNLLLVVVWIVLAILIGRENKKLTSNSIE